jgi:hypothetical protein
VKAAAAESQSYRVQIKLPETGFRKTMLFNRFRLDRENGYLLASFALTSQKSGSLDSYACILTQDALTRNKEEMLQYMERVQTALEKTNFEWAMGNISIGGSVDTADVIAAASDQTAEICLYCTSVVAITNNFRSKSRDPVLAQPLALLKSNKNIHARFLQALYEE